MDGPIAAATLSSPPSTGTDRSSGRGAAQGGAGAAGSKCRSVRGRQRSGADRRPPACFRKHLAAIPAQLQCLKPNTVWAVGAGGTRWGRLMTSPAAAPLSQTSVPWPEAAIRMSRQARAFMLRSTCTRASQSEIAAPIAALRGKESGYFYVWVGLEACAQRVGSPAPLGRFGNAGATPRCFVTGKVGGRNAFWGRLETATKWGPRGYAAPLI